MSRSDGIPFADAGHGPPFGLESVKPTGIKAERNAPAAPHRDLAAQVEQIMGLAVLVINTIAQCPHGRRIFRMPRRIDLDILDHVVANLNSRKGMRCADKLHKRPAVEPPHAGSKFPLPFHMAGKLADDHLPRQRLRHHALKVDGEVTHNIGSRGRTAVFGLVKMEATAHVEARLELRYNLADAPFPIPHPGIGKNQQQQVKQRHVVVKIRLFGPDIKAVARCRPAEFRLAAAHGKLMLRPVDRRLQVAELNHPFDGRIDTEIADVEQEARLACHPPDGMALDQGLCRPPVKLCPAQGKIDRFAAEDGRHFMQPLKAAMARPGEIMLPFRKESREPRYRHEQNRHVLDGKMPGEHDIPPIIPLLHEKMRQALQDVIIHAAPFQRAVVIRIFSFRMFFMIRQASSAARKIPRTVWTLGFVSMFMDVSSEMIQSLLPVYLITTMGVGAAGVGLMQGIAEATNAIFKVFSGAVSDFFHKRKQLAVIGYGLSALTKPLFPLANSFVLVFFARFADRIGKGIRGAPRDALIDDICPKDMHGACFGLRQSLDNVGAFIGPVIAIALMAFSGGNFRFVFWCAVIPAFFCVALLTLGVDEPAELAQKKDRNPLRFTDLKLLSGTYWRVVITAAFLMLARFSESFLVLAAQNDGLPDTWLPLVVMLMSIVYAAASFPAGIISDRFGRKPLLAVGLGVIIAADLALGLGNNIAFTLLGVALWGLHLGMTQGLLVALVADTAPASLKGTAFGVFHLITGLMLLLASVIAGKLWESIGPEATFLTGGAFSLCAIPALLLVGKTRHDGGNAVSVPH